ncbi:hypothetical protein PPROV_000229000 [Pycnococcus provasolii]|uniref:Uncharacterized protein n=1 Tax=Pycnococcus provasolii TaxID=41880 RepID=A0A830H993_9CHLO|nr:hypothetical protein PPROV_000229000 [Pycnococcus provasolii]
MRLWLWFAVCRLVGLSSKLFFQKKGSLAALQIFGSSLSSSLFTFSTSVKVRIVIMTVMETLECRYGSVSGATLHSRAKFCDNSSAFRWEWKLDPSSKKARKLAQKRREQRKVIFNDNWAVSPQEKPKATQTKKTTKTYMPRETEPSMFAFRFEDSGKTPRATSVPSHSLENLSSFVRFEF